MDRLGIPIIHLHVYHNLYGSYKLRKSPTRSVCHAQNKNNNNRNNNCRYTGTRFRFHRDEEKFIMAYYLYVYNI